MKKQSPEQMRDGMFQIATRQNLSLILNYHYEFSTYLTGKAGEAEAMLGAAKTRDEFMALQERQINFGEVFHDQLRRTTFLLMYSHAEEWFYHLWKTYAPTSQLDSRSGSLKRFKTVVTAVSKIDVSSDLNWQFLCEASKVRDCFLHANGRLSMLKKPEALRVLIHQHPEMLEVKLDRLRVTNLFLHRFNDALDAIIAVVRSEPKASLE